MIQFKRKVGDLFTVGTTDKGNLISFVEIRESNLILLDPNADISSMYRKPSEITLYSNNVEFTMSMLEVIEASKIMRFKDICNDGKQVVVYPLFSFDFSKLQNVLFDLSERFNI